MQLLHCCCSDHRNMSSSVDWQRHKFCSSADHLAIVICQLQDIFLLGGHNGGAWLDSMHLYTPAYRSISDVGKMPFARGYGGAAIIGRSIYIVGGGDGASWLQTAVRYDIDTKEWFQVCRAPLHHPYCPNPPNVHASMVPCSAWQCGCPFGAAPIC